MTKELLEQYPSICAEIRELEEMLRVGVADTVSGSLSDYPYTRHTVSVQGAPPDLRAQLEKLRGQKAEIEAFIGGLRDSRVRRIVRMRVMHQQQWETVAARMGHRYTAESVKKVYYKIFSD